MPEWVKNPCVHCGKETKKSIDSGKKWIHVCEKCFQFWDYANM